MKSNNKVTIVDWDVKTHRVLFVIKVGVLELSQAIKVVGLVFFCGGFFYLGVVLWGCVTLLSA